MAEYFDTSARLAEGLPGVADIESYVAACQALGFQHPDLTAHAGQVRDCYGSEDGMNLHALDADCAALQAVSVTASEVLARQDAQRATLAAAWHGAGAQAAREFLFRHGHASADTAAAIRAGAHALADLRDRLWYAVDRKAATAVAITDSAQARRGDWLAAAQTVTTGAGDRATASELVDQEVKPFVDSVIGEQWLSAMRAAVEAIEAAYDTAIGELASHSAVMFEIPADLGPHRLPGVGDAASPPTAGATAGANAMPGAGAAAAPPSAGSWPGAAPVTPAGWSPPAASAMSPVAAPTAASPALPVPAPPAPADPGAAPGLAAPSVPSLGGRGMPEIGSGLSSLGQQLGDLFGRLLGDGGLGSGDIEDALDLDEPEQRDEPDDLDDPDADDVIDEDVEPESEEGEDKPDEPAVPVESETCPPQAPAAVPVDVPPAEPAATPPPEPAEPAPVPPEPLTALPPLTPEPPAEPVDGTPCEIAADELPQVGE